MAAKKKIVPKKNIPKKKTGGKREKVPKKPIADDYKVGPRHPPKDKQFTTKNQPPAANKIEGKKKAKFTRDVLKNMLNLPYKFAPDSQLKHQLIAAFGEEILEQSIGEIMSFMQIQKAILKGDTYAYNTVMDQGLGRTAQAIALTDANGEDLPPIILAFPKGMNIDFPSNTDGEE